MLLNYLRTVREQIILGFKGVCTHCAPWAYSVSAGIKVDLPIPLRDISTRLSKHIVDCLSKVEKKHSEAMADWKR